MTLTLTVPDITIKTGGRLHANLDTSQVIEIALRRGEGRMSEHGALVVETGKHTGRPAQGKLKEAHFRTDPNVGFEVPAEVDGIDTQVLDPRATWADGDGYDHAARGLADRFRCNFTQFVAHVDESVRAAAPPGIFSA
jgi:ATP-dependent phosphoenolpyruvate carboxykinase